MSRLPLPLQLCARRTCAFGATSPCWQVAIHVRGTALVTKVALYALLGFLSTLQSWFTSLVLLAAKWVAGSYLYAHLGGAADGHRLLQQHGNQLDDYGGLKANLLLPPSGQMQKGGGPDRASPPPPPTHTHGLTPKPSMHTHSL